MFKLYVVIICLMVYSVKAKIELADLFSNIFPILEFLYTFFGQLLGQATAGGATSSGKTACSLSPNPSYCEASKHTTSCSVLYKCDICSSNKTEEENDAKCAEACAEFKNDSYKNGTGDYKARCVTSVDICDCKAKK
ncbi:hypothetical protein HDE_06927 [Halotydeus destructor]|nr:hypothetical protein HDE_06927 [Halotydeus destructor]